MDAVNKTLYIPLYGKAYVSQKGLFLKDPVAEAIWAAEGFALKGKSRSKWLAYYMGIRAAVFDDWVKAQMASDADAVVIHLGCGMDSRVLRVCGEKNIWFDVDFPDVIVERKRYYQETENYRMVSADVREENWLQEIPQKKRAIIVLEGVSMYLELPDLQKVLARLCGHFEELVLLMDCYTVLAAKMSRYKNPVKDVGVSRVYGLDDPKLLQNENLRFVKEHPMTPQHYIDQLQGMEKRIFEKLYAGSTSQKLYRMYEFRKENDEVR